MKQPTVMWAGFSPSAALASLITFIVSLSGVILSLPDGVLANHFSPKTVQDITDVCLVIAGLAGVHLSATRSLLPAVDGTKTITTPTDSVIEVK